MIEASYCQCCRFLYLATAQAYGTAEGDSSDVNTALHRLPVGPKSVSTGRSFRTGGDDVTHASPRREVEAQGPKMRRTVPTINNTAESGAQSGAASERGSCIHAVPSLSLSFRAPAAVGH